MTDLFVTTDSAGSALSGRGNIEKKASGKVEKPKNVIQKVSAARTIHAKAKGEHRDRIMLYSQIEGLIAGNPPYDQAELEAAGLSHIANFNTLDARSLYERSGLSFWNLINQAQCFAKFELKKFKSTVVDADFIGWANIMAEHFDDVVREWQGFITQVSTLSGQLVKFGISPVIWPDERDWRWRTVELQRFFITNQTLSDIDQLTCVTLETTFTAQYLWEAYEDAKKGKAEDTNWDTEELEKLLIRRANQFSKSGGTDMVDMMSVQRSMQNGDIGIGEVFTDSFPLVSLLYKEYDGKITHYMFDPLSNGSEMFLFMADRQYNNMQEALVIFTSSPGEFTLHSNRGVGHKIFAGCQAMNQMDCAIVDMARWASTPLIRTLGISTKEFSSIRFTPGVMTDIGSAEFVQNQIGANINQLVGASDYMGRKMANNTINSGDDPGFPDRDQGSKSAPQVKMESWQEFGVQKNSVATFYDKLDFVVQNMVAKMLHSKKGYPGYEQSKEWMDRCIEDGVPKEIFETKDAERHKLPRHMKARASRVAGDGSNLARIMALDAVAPLVGGFGAKGQDSWRKEKILAHMGRDYVQPFLSDSAVADESAGGASLAAVENFMMKSGEMPVFSMDNEHQGHIGSHLALLMHTMQSVQKEEMNSAEADKIMKVAIPHTQEHIKFIQNDPLAAGVLGKVQGPWQQLLKFAEVNRGRAEKMAQAEIRRRNQQQEQQNAAMSDIQRKDMLAQADVKRADFKVMHQVERAKEANVTRGEVMTKKVDKDAEIKSKEVDLKAQNEARKNAYTHKTEGEKQFDGTSTEEIKQGIDDMVGTTPNPFDFE